MIFSFLQSLTSCPVFWVHYKLLDGYESRESRQKQTGDYIANQTNYYQYGGQDNIAGDAVGRDKYQ